MGQKDVFFAIADASVVPREASGGTGGIPLSVLGKAGGLGGKGTPASEEEPDFLPLKNLLPPQNKGVWGAPPEDIRSRGTSTENRGAGGTPQKSHIAKIVADSDIIVYNRYIR